MNAQEIFDITRPLSTSTPVWPGDPPPALDWVSLRSAGAAANVAAIRLGVHTGTHVDAPYHVVNSGTRVGALPLERFVGPALVLDVRHRELIDGEVVRQVLSESPRPTRVIFRTGAWRQPDEFPREFATVDPAAAAMLANARVFLIGTDAPSVDPYDSHDLPAHHQFAAAGIPILENLWLDDVPCGEYELIALPLRLSDADGSPVRAVLRRRR